MSAFNRTITYSQDLYICISKVYILMNFYKAITPKESASRIKYRTWPFHAIFQSHPASGWGYHYLDSYITNWFCRVFDFYINGIIQYDLLFVWCLLLNIMFVIWNDFLGMCLILKNNGGSWVSYENTGWENALKIKVPCNCHAELVDWAI